MIGCCCHRLRRRLRIGLGDNRSGFMVVSCKELFRGLLLGSFGGSGGRCLDELTERIESLSIGRGGGGESSEPMSAISGN